MGKKVPADLLTQCAVKARAARANSVKAPPPLLRSTAARNLTTTSALTTTSTTSTVTADPLSDSRITELANFDLPDTVEGWKTATDVAGRIYGTKSRGARLVDVDKAYGAWIVNPRDVHKAESLREKMNVYRGGGLHTVDLGVFSKNYRDERDKGGIMSAVHQMADLIGRYGGTVNADEMKRKEADARVVRRRLVTLMGNIGVDWNWKGDLLGGLPLLGDIAEVTGLDEVIKSSTTAQAVLGSTVPVAVVAIGTGVTPGGSQASDSVWRKAWDKFKAFMKKIFDGFMDWAKTKLAALLDLDPMEIWGTIATILNIVFKFVMDKATPFIGAAKDLGEGVYGLCKDAWTRSVLSTQKAQLRTRDGAFALLASGIETGIKRRQAVAGWTMVKGAISLTAAMFGADKIAGLVLGALEYCFKLLWNLFEDRRIQGFLKEARLMFKKVLANHTNVFEEGINVVIATQPIDTTRRDPGYMPPFKSSNYTHDEFIGNTSAAYLNFLHSCVGASPVLAAIIMNSGIARDQNDVFHVATHHSEYDDEVAREHLAALKKEAKDLYMASSFRVTPAKVSDFQGEDNTEFQKLVNAAKLAANPEPFVLSA